MNKFVASGLTAWLAVLGGSALAQSQTTTIGNVKVSIEPFIAYYGERGDLRIVGSGLDSPIGIPRHLGCSQDTGIPVDVAIQRMCQGGKAYFNSIGQSGGNRCGYNVISGVCVKEIP
jgi:hypothetical protein